MNKLKTVFAVTLLAGMTSCAKEAQDIASDVLPTPSTCGQAGTRVEATLDGASFCANAQVLAVGDGSSLMITGVSLLGNSLVLQIDSLGLGTQAISDADNPMLLMQAGSSFVSTATYPGTLHITLVDTAAHRFTATFDVTLRNEENGSARHVQGTADVTWTSGS
jgi:hypothetical protein